MNSYNIAIVGATGLVGQTFLQVLDEYQIQINELRLFASSRSVGKKVSFQGKEYPVEVIQEGSFRGIDYALFSAGGAVSKQFAKQATNEGAVVIDNSSAWRMEKDVPLVVPEVNMDDAYEQSLIANPNCSTIQVVVPLFVLDQLYSINTIEYNTYQAVSGAGQKGVDDLHNDSPSFFPYNINKTCIPQIDVFMEDGYTNEEHKMMDETRKILHNNDLLISATCVRVPVENGHAVSVRVTFDQEYDLDTIRKAFNNHEQIVLLDDVKNGLYPTSEHAKGTDKVYVGRLRKDTINPKTLLLYTVADNIRKGAAANAIQIMKGLMEYDESR